MGWDIGATLLRPGHTDPAMNFSRGITKQRNMQSHRSMTDVVNAVLTVVRRGSSDNAMTNFCTRVDRILGDSTFTELRFASTECAMCDDTSWSAGCEPGQRDQSTRQSAAYPPSMDVSVGEQISWRPKRPKLAILLLRAFRMILIDRSRNGHIESSTIYSNGRCISKLLGKHAVREVSSQETSTLAASNELSSAQLTDDRLAYRQLTRVATDVIIFVHAIATIRNEQARGVCERTALRLHRTGERLAGEHTRGCGIVFCNDGRAHVLAAVEDGLTHLRLRKVRL